MFTHDYTPIRVSPEWRQPNESPVRCTCQVPDCGRTTRHYKPYCTEHLLEQDYPRQIQAALEEAERERERARLFGPDAVDPDGMTAQDLVLYLEQHGVRTSARLARDLNLDHELVLTYLTALRRAGRVSYPAGPRRSRRRHRERPVRLAG